MGLTNRLLMAGLVSEAVEAQSLLAPHRGAPNSAFGGECSVQCLRQSIDLILMFARRKCHELVSEVVKPPRLPRQVYGAGLDPRRVR